MSTKKKVIRGGERVLGALGSGAGQPLLTKDPTTNTVNQVPAIDTSAFISTTLLSGKIIVGNGSNVATAVTPTGSILITNTGVTSISPNVITDANIFTGAGIVYSKLSLTNSIVNADIATAANITRSKLVADTANTIVINNGAGVMSSLTTGTNTYVLTVVAGVPTWAPPTGGITSTAAANEIPKSNGTNLVGSGVYNSSLGLYQFGSGLGGTTRVLSADGTSADISLVLTGKGANGVTVGASSAPTNISGNSVIIFAQTGGSLAFQTTPGASSAGNINIQPGSGTGGAGNGGSVNITSGTGSGTGVDGAVNIQTSPSGKLGFFNKSAVVLQGPVTTPQGIADILTAYGLLLTSTISGGGGGGVTSVSFTGGIISVATPTTTPALTIAGTSGGIPYFSGVNNWASSALLAANSLMVGGGAGTAPLTVATGTGVLTALGINVGSAGAFTTFNGAHGTPSGITLTNASGLPLTTGVTGILPGANGGTGINNGASTITIGGSLTLSGAFTTSFTVTANTAVTLPTSGTLSRTAYTLNPQGGNYTFVLADGSSDALTQATSASATNFTIPPNGTVAYPVGTVLNLSWDGAGQPSWVAGAGVTINSSSGVLAMPIRYSVSMAVKTATNTWYLWNGLPGNPFADNNPLIKNNSDNTKLLTFSAANITTATTRTLTAQDANYIIAGTNLVQSFIAKQTFPVTGGVAGFNIGANAIDPTTTLAAGDMYYQSGVGVRVYSGSAWSTIGVGGGGGITNTAVNTELMMSDGTNATPSTVFIPTQGNIVLGKNATNTARSINANDGNATTLDGLALTVRAGHAFGTGNNNGGDLTLQAGTRNGSGNDGVINLSANGGTVNFGSSTNPSTSQNLVVTGSATDIDLFLRSKGTNGHIYDIVGLSSVVIQTTSTTNDVANIQDTQRQTSATAATGFGLKRTFSLENNSNAIATAAGWTYKWNDATSGSEDTYILLEGLRNGASTPVFSWDNNNLAFFSNAGTFGSGEAVTYFHDAVTNPTTNPTAGFILYSDAANSSHPTLRLPSGTVIDLAGIGTGWATTGITSLSGNTTISGTVINQFNLNGIQINQNTQSGNAASAELIIGASHTNLTAGVEYPNVYWSLGATLQFATGSQSYIRAFRIDAPTYAFVGASTITDAATFAVSSAPIKGTNASITNTHGILIQSQNVGAATNSYGLTASAMSGATNNYSAQFINGIGVKFAQQAQSTTHKFIDITQSAHTGGTPTGLSYVGGAHTSLTLSVEAPDWNINLARTVQFATGALSLQRAILIQAPTYSSVSSSSTISDAATVYITSGPKSTTNNVLTNSHGLYVGTVNLNAGSGTISNGFGLTVQAPTGATNNWAAQFLGNVRLSTAGNKLFITEGTNGSVGQTTLVSGTKAISISGLTTSSRAFVTLVTPSGTTATTTYQAVCTSGTLTIQANVAAGTINVADGSTLNYWVVN